MQYQYVTDVQKPVLWNELIEKWGEDYFTNWCKLDAITNTSFIEDFFNVSEFNGFSDIYWNPTRVSMYNNQPYKVLRRFYGVAYPAWVIKFENGAELIAYPENIIPHEMMACGFVSKV